jgi:hypothetical protein
MSDEPKQLMKVKVSSHKVTPIPIEKDSDEPILGADWFEKPYANLFLLAKKFSGKTTVIANILARCAGPKTKFIFIVSTINKDPIWIEILKLLDKDRYVAYTSINEDGVNIIDQFVDESEKQVIKWNHNYPRFIIVMDDQGKKMRDNAVARLTKNNRHHKSMVIMSAQSLTDLHPETITQLDYTLMFDRIPVPKVYDLYEKLDLSMDYDTFLKDYTDATKKPFGFLYISRSGAKDELRDGFTEKYNNV